MARISRRTSCCLVSLASFFFLAQTFVSGIPKSWTPSVRMSSGKSTVTREAAVKFTYFPLFAKGPACALALEHSGIEWEGAFPADWKTEKQLTPFLHLPMLETEDAGANLGDSTLASFCTYRFYKQLNRIGHELAILNYIGFKSQKMGGAGAQEFAISQQLMCQAEDIYQKLVKLKTGMITGEEADAFWSAADGETHNRTPRERQLGEEGLDFQHLSAGRRPL
eukprot:Skav210281  [mRNA]  locus=scaffold2977:278301:281350:- [translate_table: standard]